LQTGNFQMGAISLSILGMLAIRTHRVALGASLLGFATAAKIFPGVLILYLLVRREFRVVGIAVGSGLVFLIMTTLAFGAHPVVEFFTYQMPRLDSGDALPALCVPGAVAINASIPGLVLKLKLFGISLSRKTLSLTGWIYSAVVLGLAAHAARAADEETSPVQEAIQWLALVGLAAMRSPFLPNEYGTFPALVIAIIMLATAARQRTVLICAASVLALNVYLPPDAPLAPTRAAIFATIAQSAAVLLYAWALFRARPTKALAFQPTIA
jgi:hypothetical protein